MISESMGLSTSEQLCVKLVSQSYKRPVSESMQRASLLHLLRTHSLTQIAQKTDKSVEYLINMLG